jgi:hypothetical protein
VLCIWSPVSETLCFVLIRSRVFWTARLLGFAHDSSNEGDKHCCFCTFHLSGIVPVFQKQTNHTFHLASSHFQHGKSSMPSRSENTLTNSRNVSRPAKKGSRSTPFSRFVIPNLQPLVSLSPATHDCDSVMPLFHCFCLFLVFFLRSLQGRTFVSFPHADVCASKQPHQVCKHVQARGVRTFVPAQNSPV